MNKEQEQRFFNQVEEVLQAHEETYELGAWEEFDANRKKKKRRWPIYAWTAAAMVLLCLSIGLFQRTDQNDPQPVVVVMKNQKQMIEEKEVASSHDSVSDSHQPVRNHTLVIKSLSPAKNGKKNTFVQLRQDEVKPIINPDQVTAAVTRANPISAPVSPSAPVAVTPNAVTQKHDKFTPVAVGAYDSLMNAHRPVLDDKKKVNKFTYSLVVSPSLSNQKMNIGAGMELSYRLGNGLSINSGLMYAALNAKSDGKSLEATNTRSESANLAVTGIELPLGINYQTNGGFYASAGVSALGLLNDKLEYKFVEDKTISYAQVGAGFTNDVLKVVSERRTERSLEPLTNYMGFFNFSAGKKQAFGNLNLNVGPFVKIPFSSVSAEKIKLLQGGIKVSVDF